MSKSVAFLLFILLTTVTVIAFAFCYRWIFSKKSEESSKVQVDLRKPTKSKTSAASSMYLPKKEGAPSGFSKVFMTNKGTRIYPTSVTGYPIVPT